MMRTSFPSFRLAVLLILAVSFALVPGGTRAADGITPQLGLARPFLAGHSFVESTRVPGPFIRSYIRNRVGAGKATGIEYPPVVIEGIPIGGLKGDLAFALLDFEVQYAIREWLAIRGSFALAGRLGTDVQALLARGATLTSGFEFGWLARLAEGERTALSLELGLSNRNYTGVDILRFVEDIVDGIDPVLVNKSPSMRGFAGLRFAWAANSLIGVTARGTAGYGESLDRRSSDRAFTNLGLAVDFDVAGRTQVPLGLALAYTFDSFPEFTNDLSDGVHAFLLRIAYVGRQDFLLSLDVGQDRFPQPQLDRTISAVTVSLHMRYYF